jgi:signal transduction histidine kinase
MDIDNRASILLIDDQPGKLLTYEAMLDGLGERLIKANSAREALEILLKREVMLVLMDVSMPEVGGFELAEMVRAHPRHQKTAIIFVSAVHLTDLDRLKGYESGAVDYVSVPVVPELLRAKVRVFTELYRKREELERLTQQLEQRVSERTAELQASMARQTDLAERLKTADRRKDEFLALLAHELRNPLAPVQNALGIMQFKQLTDPQLTWCREVIDRQTRQLTRLVDDLLDVSRITRGKIRLRLETIDLIEVVRQAVETSQPLIDAQRHQLELRLPAAPLWIRGDAARMTQVLANLINNAAKYQAERGRIELYVTTRLGLVEIRVRDQGIGISPAMLPEIFQLFAQGERDLDRAFGGLGVGLSLVKTLVEMHGGTVDVISEGLGLGAEFTVRLPALAPEAPARPAPAGTHSERAATTTHRILVVDDNKDAAESLAILLRLKGHDVQVAHDGQAALALTTARTPGIVLLDIGLPGMDGYEVCRRLRQQGLLDTRIIAMTGYGQDRDRRRADDAGFNNHTVKPVEIRELEKLLESA